MNYAVVYLAGILFFALGYWFLRGKRFYTGPLVEAEIDEADSTERSSGEEISKNNQEKQEGVVA